PDFGTLARNNAEECVESSHDVWQSTGRRKFFDSRDPQILGMRPEDRFYVVGVVDRSVDFVHVVLPSAGWGKLIDSRDPQVLGMGAEGRYCVARQNDDSVHVLLPSAD